MRCVLRYFLSVMVCFSLYAEFVGPPSTSGGIVEREIQQDYEERPVDPNRPAPNLEMGIPSEQLEMDEGISVFIKRIHIEGNTVLSQKELSTIISPYEGKELSMQQIQEVCVALQKKYIEKGYFLARSYPPPQEIQNGVLTLQVVEGTLGTVLIQGNRYYKTRYIAKYFKPYQGKAVHYDQLYKTLFLLNENADLQATLAFKKGEKIGTTDVIVQVQDKKPFHWSVNENNFGSKQTALWRTGTRIDYGNLMMDGDMFSVIESIGNPVSHLNYTFATYTAPINTKGTKATVSYGYNNYHVSKPAELQLRGISNLATLQISQALQRTRRKSTNVYGAFEYKQIKNYVLGETNSFDKLRVAKIGWNVDSVDSYKGRNVADISLSYGIPHFLGGLHTKDTLCSRKGAGGLFAILHVDYFRLQALPKNCLLSLHFSGQATPYKLPLAQQIFIGGSATVRGFREASALGDDGYYVNVELKIPPPWIGGYTIPLSDLKWKQFIQFVGFVDNGGVALNGSGEAQKRRVMMTGAGVGARLQFPHNLSMSMDVGFPLTQRNIIPSSESGLPNQSSPMYYFRVNLQIF